MKATTGFFLDKRRIKNDGTFPVKLRVTFNRKPKLFNANISLTEEDFKKVMGKSPRGALKDIRLELNELESQAVDIINKIDPFSFGAFETKFLKKNVNTLDVFQMFEVKLHELEKEDQLNTHVIYKCAFNSLKEFHSSKMFYINDVTVKFLNDYEKWMLASNRSLTTISIYTRSLRAVYNMIIEENQLQNVKSPFGKKKYQIPAPKNIKKALSLSELKLLYDYQPEEGSPEQMYRDLWFFSYLCSGMNMKDICLLQHKNIQNGHIYFYREKTIKSVRDSKPIDVVLMDDTNEIINRWGTPPDNPEDYVFPFITHDMDKKRIMGVVKQVTKMTNKWIRKIARKVGVDKNVTTYWARHTYATVLMRSNVGTEFIKEQLGHKSLNTTQNYLDSFEDDSKRKIAEKLLEF